MRAVYGAPVYGAPAYGAPVYAEPVYEPVYQPCYMTRQRVPEPLRCRLALGAGAGLPLVACETDKGASPGCGAFSLRAEPSPALPSLRASPNQAGDAEVAMTAVDFEAFVDDLATLSGTAIMPFFRTALGVEDKSGGGSFDPVTEADRAAEAAIRHKIRGTLPESWRDGRGIWLGARSTPSSSGCSTRSTAPRASSPACRAGAR